MRRATASADGHKFKAAKRSFAAFFASGAAIAREWFAK